MPDDLESLPISMPVVAESDKCPSFPSDDSIVRAFINDLIENKKMDLISDVPVVKKITTEFLSEDIHPPREMPLVGMVQIHERKFRCTIDFESENGQVRSETFESDFEDIHKLNSRVAN